MVEGWSHTEQEAYREGMKKLGSDFEVVKLPTMDREKAKSHVRAIISERFGLDMAFKRFRDKPLSKEANK